MLLTGCREGAVRTEVVEVPVDRVVTLDKRLTAQEPAPERPADRCRDAQNRSTLCNRDLAGWLNEYDAALARINARMLEIAGLQPDGEPKP